MIHMISGTVHHITTSSIIVDTGFIAFELFVPQPTQFQIKQEAKIVVYMHWNQEQGPSLYGFETVSDREIFCCILSCPGFGPKVALAILAQLGISLFLEAIQTNNAEQLCTVDGIGLKKAEQLIVQLRHKISALLKRGVIDQSLHTAHWHTIDQALTSLNYSRSEIHQALDYLKTKKDQQSFDQLMRLALSFLSKQA